MFGCVRLFNDNTFDFSVNDGLFMRMVTFIYKVVLYDRDQFVYELKKEKFVVKIRHMCHN